MKKQTKKHWRDYWKGKSRLTIITYAVVRLIVVAVLIRSLFTGQAESAFTCVLTLFLLFLPSIVSRKMHMQLPTGLEVTIVIFIFAAEILGELACFYVTVPLWDKALHTVSGFIYAAVGYSMADILNRDHRVSFRLFMKDLQKDTIVSAITSVTLDPTRRNIPITISGITDVAVNGESLGLGGYLDIGLYDTMGDLIVNLIGALVFSVIGFFHQKSQRRSKVAEMFVPTVQKEEDHGRERETED